MDNVYATGFGQWLQQQRNLLDLTRAELGERIGYSLETIKKIENGERRPSKEMARALAAALDVPAEKVGEFVQFARTGGAPIWSLAGQGAPAIAPASNLPAPLTPLIGRQAELRRIVHLFTQQGARLITLAGAPGVGKTRLAIQAGHHLQRHYADGVWFVDLAPIEDGSFLLSAVATVLSIDHEGAAPLTERVYAHLRERHLLLVLDNFEQIVEAAPQIASLLKACGQIACLVTSRVPLYVSGEYEVAVTPFALPPPEKTISPEILLRNEAVNLFVDRVQAFQPDFELSSANCLTILELCRRLDGIALAIELAAARLRLFTPDELLANLAAGNGSLGLLTHGARDLPARQQTLYNAIAWSYGLLSAREQQFFASLGVFHGAFDDEAARAVCVDRHMAARGD